MTIELALAALTNLEERDRGIGAECWMRIERARYDAELAERRYEAVDPCNRLIAATLEARWNDAMQRLHDLEADWYQRNQRGHYRRRSRSHLLTRKTPSFNLSICYQRSGRGPNLNADSQVGQISHQ